MNPKKRMPVLATLATVALSPLPAQAGSVDEGRVLYNNHCVFCHGRNWKVTTSDVELAISWNVGGMGFLSFLSATQLDDIATYTQYPNTTDTDRLLNWAETQFPALLTPKTTLTKNYQGYYARHYTATNIYAGSKGGSAYLYDGNNPGAGWQDLGTLRYWLQQSGL
jgi:hypothetical protein